MTVHFYFLPVERTVVVEQVYRGPRYLKWRINPSGIAASWYMIDYGMIDVAFACADTALTDHQIIFDAPDTLSVDPRNGSQRDLDVNISAGEISALTDFLDTPDRFCPLEWANPSDSRRDVLRGICGVFLFIQRVTTLAGNLSLPEWGVTMNTKWSDLSSAQQGYLSQAAEELGFSVPNPNAGMKIRNILRHFGSRWTQPIPFGELAVL